MKKPIVWVAIVGALGWGLWGYRVYLSSQLKDVSWELADEAYEAVGLAEEYKKSYEECLVELAR